MTKPTSVYLAWIDNQLELCDFALEINSRPIENTYLRASLLANRAGLVRHKVSVTRYINNFIGCDNCSSTNGFVPFPCPTYTDITNQLDKVMRNEENVS